MSSTFYVVLEHDGKNPAMNDFVCSIDEFTLGKSTIRGWLDMYSTDLMEHPRKRHSPKTLRHLEAGLVDIVWSPSRIGREIESLKKELELGDDAERLHSASLEDIISELQRLYDLAMESIERKNLDPEKCYLVWSVDS